MENGIGAVIEKVKPSFLRKYLWEYAVLALAACVIFLFLAFNDLNKFIRTELSKQREEMIRTIDKNTDAINRLNNVERYYSK